jgi:hypothetical protein
MYTICYEDPVIFFVVPTVNYICLYFFQENKTRIKRKLFYYVNRRLLPKFSRVSKQPVIDLSSVVYLSTHKNIDAVNIAIDHGHGRVQPKLSCKFINQAI